ncbi:MAG: hypothetical protein SP1CHLAM54_05940 [Chlamydiia bacterium]|nr:hypothetical protein [Chlamydiia bacterium]MCH9615504.1 hypothetical protein [Chlamydiia bacterium]MCH9629159.1 hypothetical protein [Chlamydiia bacterium]
MAIKKKILDENLDIMDAVDNLSHLAELEEGETKAPTVDAVKGSFRAVHDYLKTIYSGDKDQLKSVETQKGVQAIMQLAGEAAERMDKMSSVFGKVHGKEFKPLNLKEFEELKKFYHDKIVKRFQDVLEHEDEWQEEWGSGEQDPMDIERVGLKDLQTVKRDKKYELFHIRKEDGKPYFNRNLLRHIRLVHNFDDLICETCVDDPLLKIKILEDKELYESALEIRDECAKTFASYFKDALKFKEIEMVNKLNMASMALLLATNERNLLSTAYGKSVHLYFKDFLSYLRTVVSSTDYMNTLEQTFEELDPLRRALIHLTQRLCFRLITRKPDSSDVMAHLYSVLKRSYKEKFDPKTEGMLAYFNRVLDYHEGMSELLRHFPNGPLFKTLDVFRRDVEKFDPIMQDNIPHRQFTLKLHDNNTMVLRMGCPTWQETIDKAFVNGEFLCYLRHLKCVKEHHLLINLQNRTSWEEFTRSETLEHIQLDAEYAPACTIVTLAKDTEFYNQTDSFLKETNASTFKKMLAEQVKNGASCGFYFPKTVPDREIKTFTKEALSFIHQNFFDGKAKLTRKSRLEFIELYYAFLTLKVMDIIKPQYMSLTCKDAVDSGPCASAMLYGILRLLQGDEKWDEDEKIFFLYLIYAPALMVRERTVDLQRLSRLMSALTTVATSLENDRSKIVKGFSALYETDFLSKLKIDIN